MAAAVPVAARRDCRVAAGYREQDYKRMGVMLRAAALPAKSRRTSPLPWSR
jgi:hypothetical protein